MTATVIVSGMVIGFLIAVPTGPVGFICVKRTLVNGFKAGIISSIGSITADLCYSIVIVFGLKFFADFLINHKLPLHIISGIFLIYIGVRGIYKKISEIEVESKNIDLVGDFSSTYLLTITNPTLLFTFTIIFSSLGPSGMTDNMARVFFILGIFIGSLLWWIFFTHVISTIHRKYFKLDLQKVNRFSSYFIAFIGLVIIGIVLLH